MSLEQSVQNGKLQASATSLAEITQLFAVVDRELHDAQLDGLSTDNRFTHAYEATLILCTIALRVSGYKVRKGESCHVNTIQSISMTLGPAHRHLEDELDLARRRRATAVYERVNAVQSRDAAELLNTAVELRRAVIVWMDKNHSRLLPNGLS